MSKRSQDLATAKAKKQKIILIVGGVLLLAVAGLQGPKLLKGSGSSAAPAAEAGTATDATGAPVPVVVVAVPTKGSAVVAGVALPRGEVVKADTNQLASFTLFEVKDPFVPKVSDHVADPASSATASVAPAGSSDTGTAGTGSVGSTSGSTAVPAPPAAPASPIIYATINFDGKLQQVQVKGTFPTPGPIFVLRSLKKKQAKISVAGGSFDGGEPVTLEFGKKVTLVNTATGVRYELKLVYTGTQPEVIEGFTTSQGQTAAAGTTSTADASTTTPAK